jgi:RNA polymerase sigma factor (TIGR02999 family)
MGSMSQVTQILTQIETGDSAAAAQLLPLVYEELRKLAAVRLAREKPGQTLQATALVHEAYLRLTAVAAPELGLEGQTPRPAVPGYMSRGHFFAAAAEAMRRILIDSARRKQTVKHGGGHQRVDLELAVLAAELPAPDLLAFDEALTALARHDPQAAQLVQLHCFAGLTIEEASLALGLSERTAYRDWSYARAWLHRELQSGDSSLPG